jgi:hypothetical protein
MEETKTPEELMDDYLELWDQVNEDYESGELTKASLQESQSLAIELLTLAGVDEGTRGRYLESWANLSEVLNA